MVLFAPRVSKTREKLAYLTMFGHYETEIQTANNNNNNNNNNKNEQEQEERN